MRKLFSFLTAILFAGSMFAADATVYTSNVTLSASGGTQASTATVTISSTNYNAIKLGKSGQGGDFSISVPANTTTLTLHAAGWNGKSSSLTLSTTATGVTISPSTATALHSNSGIANNSPFTVTPDNTTEYLTYTLTGVNAATTIKLAATGERCVIWGVNAEVASSDPAITAGNISFGTIYMPNGNSYSHQYELTVAGTALSNPIEYTSSNSEKVAVTGTLTNTGGKLTVVVTAPHGDLDETITLTSGQVEKVVNVTGTVQAKYTTPMSVAEALTAFENGTLIVNDSLQIRGLAKTASSIYSTSATVVITDIDDDLKEFKLYAIKSLNKANFASIENNVAIDENNYKFIPTDTLTAYGKVGSYGEPANPQIASGGYLTAINRNKALIVPEITASPKSISLTSHEGATDQSITITYDNWEAAATSATATLYSDDKCTSDITLGGWVSNFDFNDDFTELTFDVSENTVTSARTAYIKVVASNNTTSENAEVVISVSQAAAPTVDTYKPTALASIKSSDVVIVTMSKDSKTYSLSSAVTTGRPAAVNVTDKISDGNLSVYSNTEMFWNVVYDSENKGYILYPNGETARWLTATPSGDPRINTGGGKYWTINKEYLYNASANKHIGVWTNTPDWRTYLPKDNGDVHDNIAGETLCFYVKDNGSATALDNTEVEGKAVKVLRDGQIFIEKNGRIYNMQGQIVK